MLMVDCLAALGASAEAAVTLKAHGRLQALIVSIPRQNGADSAYEPTLTDAEACQLVEKRLASRLCKSSEYQLLHRGSSKLNDYTNRLDQQPDNAHLLACLQQALVECRPSTAVFVGCQEEQLRGGGVLATQLFFWTYQVHACEGGCAAPCGF
jgi:hypothetical protein